MSYTDSFVDFISEALKLKEPFKKKSFNNSVLFLNNSTLGNFFSPKFEKIKAIKIYENTNILENYSNNKKNGNNVA